MGESFEEDSYAFALKGAVVTAVSEGKLDVRDQAYVVCEDGLCRGVFDELPAAYDGIEVFDYSEQLITPGFVDLHTHGPQYNFRGLQMDLELLDWLERYTFPEEAKFNDLTYAERSYDLFTEDLYEGATTRALIYGTTDVASTILLMELLEETGLITYVGKVNIDRNAPDYLCESTEESLELTREWIEAAGDFDRTYPILTPRFGPGSTEGLLEGIRDIALETGLKVQSHMSENPSEIAWVRELFGTENTGEAFMKCGLFGGEIPTVMAHCVHSPEDEIRLMKEQGVFVAHCPESNMNLTSGIAPIRRYLREGIPVGIGTDISAGSTASMLQAVKQAIEVSKIAYRYINSNEPALTMEEAFYLGTMGGGRFFGKVGAFLDGYEFDAVVFDDSPLETMLKVSTKDRLERLIYCGDDRHVVGKFVRGAQLY